MSKPGIPEELARLLRTRPDLERLDILFVDMNGVLRGKRVPPEEFAKALGAGVNMPGATALLDMKGRTFDQLTEGSRDGDPDMICRPLLHTLALQPWAGRPSAQVFVTMFEANGAPYYADPRQVLVHALVPLHAAALRPVTAVELEFYLVRPGPDGLPRPCLGRVPGSRLEQEGPQYACLDDLDDVEPVLADIEQACRTQNLPAGATVAEFAAGQFEINLHHVDDPLLACDHAVMLKRIVKSVANRHGLGATFMAKPFADAAGSGLHIHASVLDAVGRNIFSDPASTQAPPMAPALRHAVAGLAATMREGMAIFAPNANSYRRLQPGTFVPLRPDWGVNHRAPALRIPMSGASDVRVEHRVAGADANPYLVMAAVMGGIHHGLSQGLEPGPMIQAGDVVDDDSVTLPRRWEAALDAFDDAAVLPRYLGERYARVYALCRRTECERFHAEVGAQDYAWYLRAL